MAATPDHIGVSGMAMYRGIPATTVAWTTAIGSHSLTVFNSIDKQPEANVKESAGNDGEIIEMNRTNKRFKVKFACKPVSSTTALALAIAEDLPMKMDILTVTVPTGGDPQASSIVNATPTGNTVICDSANAKWSPDGELTVDIDATVWIGKTFSTFPPPA